MISAGISAPVTHRFVAAPPEPKPRGYTPSLDLERRATCSCGWRASGNSRDSGAATDLWAREHRSTVDQGLCHCSGGDAAPHYWNPRDVCPEATPPGGAA